MIGAPSVEGPRTQWSSTLQFLQSVIVTLIGGEGTSKKKGNKRYALQDAIGVNATGDY